MVWRAVGTFFLAIMITVMICGGFRYHRMYRRTSPLHSSCRQPCINVSCPNVELPCSYGNYATCGGCCLECRNGPGEWCEGYEGPCGEGMECVGAINLSFLPGVLRPGRCQWIETTNATDNVTNATETLPLHEPAVVNTD